MNSNFISPRAEVHPSVYLGRGVCVHGPSVVHEGVVIEDYAIIGKPSLYELQQLRDEKISDRDIKHYDSVVERPTIIHRNSLIGRNSCIYSGSTLHEYVECEENIRVGWDSEIGAHSHIVYGGMIYCRVRTGIECRISGFVGNDTLMGDYVQFFGNAVHSARIFETEDRIVPAPKIDDRAFIGMGAILVGGVQIGEESYVAAGAIVTEDVPNNHIISGINKCDSQETWPGRVLNESLERWRDLFGSGLR